MATLDGRSPSWGTSTPGSCGGSDVSTRPTHRGRRGLRHPSPSRPRSPRPRRTDRAGGTPRSAVPAYAYTVVADSGEDGLDPFASGCASINDQGSIAFRAGRLADDGFDTVDGIYRADAGRSALTTIVESEARFDFLGRNPSMNDVGQVSFAASLEAGGEAILRGGGGPPTVIARTKPGRFNFVGFDTSVNDEGRVAFKAELDERYGFDEVLFSGAGEAVATHYRASSSDSTAPTRDRPSTTAVTSPSPTGSASTKACS